MLKPGEMTTDAAIPANPIRILVVDDHAVVREGLAIVLDRAPGLRVVGFAATGAEASLAADRLHPGVILMDLVLPDFSGIDATRKILARQSRCGIIAVSGCHSPAQVYRALQAGARGYVNKSATSAELIHAVRCIAAGSLYVTPGMLPSMPRKGSIERLPKNPFDQLSQRERQVLRRVVAGSTSADIAELLSLSAKTVDTYRGRLMTKLGVRNRSELIRVALENELTIS